MGASLQTSPPLAALSVPHTMRSSDHPKGAFRGTVFGPRVFQPKPIVALALDLVQFVAEAGMLRTGLIPE